MAGSRCSARSDDGLHHRQDLVFERSRDVLRSAPAPFEWLGEALVERIPVIECSIFSDRESWSVRFARRDVDLLKDSCFGCDARPPSSAAIPSALAWVRDTLGTINLIAEQSGSAPVGRKLAEIAAEERAVMEKLDCDMRAAGFAAQLAAAGVAGERYDRWADPELREAADWVSLYEADGDWVFADTESDRTLWVGSEWSGTLVTDLEVPWRRAATLILSRLVEGAFIRPTDLTSLGPPPARP